MHKIDFSTIRLIQSVKKLFSRSDNLSLADRLFLDAMTIALSFNKINVENYISNIIGKTLAATRIGEIFQNDINLMGFEGQRNYAQALRALAPLSCQRYLANNEILDIPVLNAEAAPDFAHQLCLRTRAGFENPEDGLRSQGFSRETQGGHALTTCVIAAIMGSVDAALLALFHNAHLSIFPDTPHLVERGLTAEKLSQMENEAKGEWLKILPNHFLDSLIYKRIELALGNKEAINIFNQADFLDRTFWLLEINPNWLEPTNIDKMKVTLCNFDDRLKEQEEILKEIQLLYSK